MKHLLEIKNLKISFDTEYGRITALDEINFSISENEIVAIVGESGCGKSVTSLSILKLIPSPPLNIDNGYIMFNGEDLLKKTEKEMRKIRGRDIAMIFQEPMTSLNPVFTCGNQLMEALQEHRNLTKKQSKELSIEMLRLVGIPLAEQHFNAYPHQMSGGMRQRVMIGMALCCSPNLLIADEPTTALDVTIQAQILDLLIKLKNKLGMSILLITHDMGVVAQMAQRVIVMYAGRVVEEASVRDLFKKPSHPYTQDLLNSIPKLNIKDKKLQTIPGNVPSLRNMPSGCQFHPRCRLASNLCTIATPSLREIAIDHKIACWLGTKDMKSIK